MGTIQSQTKKSCWDSFVRNEKKELKNEAKLIAKKKLFLLDNPNQFAIETMGKEWMNNFSELLLILLKCVEITRWIIIRNSRSVGECWWNLISATMTFGLWGKERVRKRNEKHMMRWDKINNNE